MSSLIARWRCARLLNPIVYNAFSRNNSSSAQLTVEGVTIVRTAKDAQRIVGVVEKLPSTTVHAWDTEVDTLDLDTQSPVGHGRVICASFFSGPNFDYGSGPRVWIDALAEEKTAVLLALRPILESDKVRKVWHNYGFDRHVLGNHGLDVRGFHADTMHMARLHSSSRDKTGLGGYSLASLSKTFVAAHGLASEKRSMLDIFGRHRKKKNGEDSKIRELPPLEEIQKHRDPAIASQWIQYSTLDAEVTWHLFQRLKLELSHPVTAAWRPAEVCFRDVQFGTVNALDLKPGERDTEAVPPVLYELYERVLRPFGEILTDMEREGIMVDVSKIDAAGDAAEADREAIMMRFRSWAASFTGHDDMRFFNLHSDMQKAQFLFGLPRELAEGKDRKEVEGESSSPGVGQSEESRELVGTGEEVEGEVEEEFVIDVTDSHVQGEGWSAGTARYPGYTAKGHPLAREGSLGAQRKTTAGVTGNSAKQVERSSGGPGPGRPTPSPTVPVPRVSPLPLSTDGSGPGLVRRRRASRSAPSVLAEPESGSGSTGAGQAAEGQGQGSTTAGTGRASGGGKSYSYKMQHLLPVPDRADFGPGHSFFVSGRGALLPFLVLTLRRKFHSLTVAAESDTEKDGSHSACQSFSTSITGVILGMGGGMGLPMHDGETQRGNQGQVEAPGVDSTTNTAPGEGTAPVKRPRGKRVRSVAAAASAQGGAHAEHAGGSQGAHQWMVGNGMIGLGDSSSDSELEYALACSYSDVSDLDDAEEVDGGETELVLGAAGGGGMGGAGEKHKGVGLEGGAVQPSTAKVPDQPPSALPVPGPVLAGGYIRPPPPPQEDLSVEYEFEAENSEGWIEPGKTKAKKKRPFIVRSLLLPITERTPKGRAAGTAKAIKSLVGKPIEEGPAYLHLTAHQCSPSAAMEACSRIADLLTLSAVDTIIETFILPLRTAAGADPLSRVHCSLNLNTETGRLSARRPNLQNQPSLERDRFKIRSAFVAAPGKCFVVADYGQLELRVLAHLTKCASMIAAFAAGGDFHSRTAMGMYPHVRAAVDAGEVILEWPDDASAGPPPKPLLKDKFKEERRKAKILNFSIAYGKTAYGLSKDWGVSLKESEETVRRWYADRPEVESWQAATKDSARRTGRVYTLLGRHRDLAGINTRRLAGHMERAAINTPIQGSAADIVMAAMLKLAVDGELRAMGYKQILQVHDEVVLEGPVENGVAAKDRVVHLMGHPFDAQLLVDLAVDAKVVGSWGDAK